MKEMINVLATQDNTKILSEDVYKFNAPHHFKVVNSHNNEELVAIDFQEGPILENGLNGIFNEDLIIMVLERLKSFQASDFACEENAMAIIKLEEALMWLRKRTLDRQKRGVQGTYNK